MHESERPNILFVMSDTHTASATGCFGSDAVSTPNLDRLAGEGVSFERAYCQNPICVPSRQSLVTGKRSFETGVIHNDQPMPALYTMAHRLSEQGYTTAALGKMHFVPDTEASCGHERHYGFMERVDYEEFWRFLREEREYPPVTGVSDDPQKVIHLEKWQHVLQSYGVVLPGATEPCQRHIMPAGAMGTLRHRDHQEALVLARWEEFLQRNHDAPFLAFVSFQSPHPPFVPPVDFLSQYPNHVELPAPPRAEMHSHPIWAGSVRTPPEEERMRYLRHYFAFVSYMDWCVGEALRLLNNAGYAQDTLVVYVSDHGDMGFHHGLTGKCVFYEESVRVPLIMRLPGVISAGQRYAGLVELIDLFPTVCEFAGIDSPGDVSGRSLVPDLIARQSPGKDAIFSESYPMMRNRDVFGSRAHRMILTREWKMIQYGEHRLDLFDVVHDPENHATLAGEPRYKAVEQCLLDRLTDCLGPLPPSEWD